MTTARATKRPRFMMIAVHDIQAVSLNSKSVPPAWRRHDSLPQRWPLPTGGNLQYLRICPIDSYLG